MWQVCFAVFVIPIAVVTTLALVEILVYRGDLWSPKKKQRRSSGALWSPRHPLLPNALFPTPQL